MSDIPRAPSQDKATRAKFQSNKNRHISERDARSRTQRLQEKAAGTMHQHAICAVDWHQHLRGYPSVNPCLPDCTPTLYGNIQ